jgi:CHASE3 domain sensor protein
MSVSFDADRARTPARASRVRQTRGRTAVEQARLVLLIMINLAQLWILSATVEAALAHNFRVLLPLVVASFVCFLITLSVLLWWRPVSRRHTSTGYVRERKQ